MSYLFLIKTPRGKLCSERGEMACSQFCEDCRTGEIIPWCALHDVELKVDEYRDGGKVCWRCKDCLEFDAGIDKVGASWISEPMIREDAIRLVLGHCRHCPLFKWSLRMLERNPELLDELGKDLVEAARDESNGGEG